MVEYLGILKLAKETAESVFKHVGSARDKPWEELTFALDKLSDLVKLHVRAVSEVTVPILTDGDVAETARRYSLLVNNPDFALGYDSVRGTLSAVQKVPGFQDKDHKERVRAVVGELSTFQQVVFTPAWDSFRVSDAVLKAAKVAAADSPSAAEIAQVAGPFVEKFIGLPGAVAPAGPLPNTAAELSALLQDWFKLWQRTVQRASYGGLAAVGGGPGGVGAAISQLRMLRHE